MSMQKATKKPSVAPLLIFAALGALFGSGTIIGLTVLTSPTLFWQLLGARLVRYLVCFGILFFAIWGYGSIARPVAYLSLPVACVACGVRTVYESAAFVDGLPIALVFCALSLGAIVAAAYAMAQDAPAPKPASKSTLPWPQICAIALVTLAAAASLALFIRFYLIRFNSLQTDGASQAQIGQMLYYMQHSGLPFTTVTSGSPHLYLATDFSPLWYLLLPVYLLSGHDLMAVGIALYAIMLSAAVPLWRICKRFSLSPMVTCALSAAMLLCPLLICGGVGGGSLSMLSLPLLLWLADALLGKRPYLALIPLLLCLGVGLQVTVWTVFVCLYLALSADKKKWGLICLAVSGLGLIATVIWLAVNQSPVLTGLFSGIGLQLVPKLRFLALLLIPTALLFVFCRQRSALVLLIPLALCHLVANASVYSGVFSSYAYPAMAALWLLCAVGAQRTTVQIKQVRLSRVLPAFALSAAMLLSMPYVMLTESLYEVENQDIADAARIRTALDKLPQNASVTASESLLPELCDRTWLFSLDADPEHPDTNVIVLDLREDFIPSDMEAYGISYYTAQGYTLREDLSVDGLVAILYK